MKSLLTLLAALVATVVLSGCEITGPKVKFKSPIEVEGSHDRDKGDFCPPGQAKKGRC